MKIPAFPLAVLLCAPVASAAIVTQWTFEDDVITPSTGTGSASLLSTTATFAAGSGGGRGWNTTSYQAQGAGSGTAGVQFNIPTAGYSGLSLEFDHRASGTASRWAQIDYSLDGGTSWVTGFWNNGGGLSPHDEFYRFTVDLSSVDGAADNPDFAIRIVSIFSPVAFDQNAALADFEADAVYMRANAQASYTLGGGLGTGDYAAGGTWRFDNVTLHGSVIPEPSAAMLGLVGILGLLRRRRC